MKTKQKDQMKKLDCPRCSIVMEKIIENDIVIDVCKKCGGMWLDKEEVDKLVFAGGKNEKK